MSELPGPHIPIGGSGNYAGQGGGGASSLTDLDDVSGIPGTGKAPVSDGSGDFPLIHIVTQDDLDAILASVAAVDWHVIGDPGEPGFEPGWHNLAGQAWAPCRYRRTLNSAVFIEGVIACDTPLWGEAAPAPIFRLPADCLPGGDLSFAAESGIGPSGGGPTLSRIVVLGDGTVAWGGYITVGEGAETFLSLCGIVFSVGAASP